MLKYGPKVSKQSKRSKILGSFAWCLSMPASGRVSQSVTCLTADPGFARSIPAQSQPFVEIDREIISTAILIPSADSRSVVVSYKRK